jgi:hypothetical protein
MLCLISFAVYVNDDGGYESVLFVGEDDDGDTDWLLSSEMERRWDCHYSATAFCPQSPASDPTDCEWKESVERGGSSHWLYTGIAITESRSSVDVCEDICDAHYCGTDCPICAGTGGGFDGNGCHGCEADVVCSSGANYASLIVRTDMQEGGWASGLVLGASMAGIALVVVGAAVVVRSRRRRIDRAVPLPMAVDDSDAQEEAGSDADESEKETLHP